MKKAFLLSALIVGASFVNAQSFYESYESGPAGWGTGTNTFGNAGAETLTFGSGDWVAQNLSSPAGLTGWFSNRTIWTPNQGLDQLCANFNSSTGANDINSFFMSPVRTFNNGDKIRFWTRCPAGSIFPDRLRLLLSTSGASTSAGDFTITLAEVNPGLAASTYPETYTAFEATISGLGGPTSGRFAFNYNVTAGGPAGANSDFISIDSVNYGVGGVYAAEPLPPAAPVFSQQISVAGPTATIDAPGDTDNVIVNYTTTSAINALPAGIFFTGTYDQVNTASYATEANIRIRDTAQPTLFADIDGFVGLAVAQEVQTNVARTMTGSLIGSNIASGAAMTLEFWESFQDSADAPEGTITGLLVDLYTVPPAGVNLTGTLNLGDTVFGGAYTRSISYNVMQGTVSLASGSVLADASSESFSITVPASATGAATIEWDGSSFLTRKTNVNLTGSAVVVGSVTVQNGDVDNSGEVDAVDIDEVIADFGDTSDNTSDVDVSGEVDAADIDIVIANFGGVND